MRYSAPLMLAALTLAACSDSTGPTPARLAPAGASLANATTVVGGVFTQTNDATANAVLAYARHTDGSLSYLGAFSTGGTGTGGAFGSQAPVALSPNERFLFAVNAGSNEVTSFTVAKDGLTRVTTVSTGGVRPVSVAATNHLVYVINATSSTLAGFRVGNDGSLEAVPEWTRSLAPGTSGGAQVLFTRDGRFLVVVARTSNNFNVFAVNPDGSLGAPVASPSVSPAPFGFDVTPRGQLIVSDPGPRSLSSYDILADGSLQSVSPLVGAFQVAPCWVVVTNDGRFAYVANAGSGSVSGYSVGADGSLALLTPGGVTGSTGAGTTPLDLDVSRDGRFLYVLENGTGNVMSFAIANDGSLGAGVDTPPPAGLRGRGGLAAY